MRGQLPKSQRNQRKCKLREFMISKHSIVHALTDNLFPFILTSLKHYFPAVLLQHTLRSSLTFYSLIWSNMLLTFLSTCGNCIEDQNCGYCYIEDGYSAVNGSCLSKVDNHGIAGRCNSTVLPPGVVWGVTSCPSTYFWMCLLGLTLYLVTFSPGMWIYLFYSSSYLNTLILLKVTIRIVDVHVHGDFLL